MFELRPLTPEHDESFDSPVLFDGDDVGAAQGIGARDHQEDALVVESLESEAILLETLSDQTVKDILVKVCESLNRYILANESSFKSQDYFGSTKQAGAAGLVVLTLPKRNRYWLLNLGDCCAYEIIQNQITLLNTRHRPSSPIEAERLSLGKHPVFGNRLGGVLSLSRAFGYHKALPFGLSHEPEVISGQLPNQGYLLLASDGLSEGEGFTSENVIESLNSHESLAIKSQRLVKKAYALGSRDNVSVLLASTHAQSQPSLLGVFDGFNGDSVAKYCAQNIKRTFCEVLKPYRYDSPLAIIFSNNKKSCDSLDPNKLKIGRLTMN